MTRQPYWISWTLFLGLVFTPGFASAEDGQADLDKATDLKLQASNLEDLGQVAALCEQAIKKGLDADDETFAVLLLTGTLYERVGPQVELLTQNPELVNKLQDRRKAMLDDLHKILKYDPKFGQAYLMIAQLEGLAGGDRKEARKSADRAIELLKDKEREKMALVKAFLVRGQLQETEEARLADFNRAVELDPENPMVWQTRAFYFLLQGQVEKAISDFNTLLLKDGDNLLVRLTIADTLLQLDKIDEAMKHVNHVIEEKPNVLALKLRAQLWAAQERFDKALEDVEAALKLEPDALELYLMRARIYHIEQRNALAKTDVERVLRQRPDYPPALDLHSLIAAAMEQYGEAIKDAKTLLANDPDNLRYALQLAIYLNAAGDSEESIDRFTDILKTEPGNAAATRGRADAYLNIGAHKEAIADYEAALKSAPDDSGLLNNFAWVLATSPHDQLRDGKRAIGLARKACELTDYKMAHILSTLAAAYAESGDFENAKKWSTKACEIGDESIKEQLEKELASYNTNKPWREAKADEPVEPEQEQKKPEPKTDGAAESKKSD